MTTKTAIDDGETPLSSSQPGREVRSQYPPSVFTHKDPRMLRPHQKNSVIYGPEEDVTELIDSIRNYGLVRPLVVTPTDTIISGHRRCKAVLALGWEEVLVEVRQFPDELAELEAILLENDIRFKTIEQKVREGEAWYDIEMHRAKQRQQQAAAATNQKLGRTSSKTLVQNFAEASKGTTRERIASRVGIGSGFTYSKAAKVVSKIDESTLAGHLQLAQVLRLVLNEKSVDAAHKLTNRPPQECQEIAELLVNGKAKSIKEAVKMLKQNNHAENHPPSPRHDEGFSVGDWVVVNDQAQDTAHIGQKGQVEQIFPVEQQLSVKLIDSAYKVRFYPHELTLIVKAPPPNPFRVGEIAFIDIDLKEAVATQEKRWNGFWGKVTHIGEVGSLTVDVGPKSLQLFPRDLKQIDAQGTEFRSVVERVLRLRRQEIDEFESGMLDMLQRREWFTPRHLDYLGVMEKFLRRDERKTENHQVVSFRSR